MLINNYFETEALRAKGWGKKEQLFFILYNLNVWR